MVRHTAPTVDGGSKPTSSLQFPKAHQRLIRERHATEHDPLLAEKLALATTMKNARVREIPKSEAKKIILKYEWLGNMGTTDYAFGLYFGEHLAGAVCFGRTGGTNTAASVAGAEHAHLVKVLNRGACVHWAHPNSASFLIAHACRLLTDKGFHIFVAYSDAEAGEIGTVYQASNWLYAGTTNSASSSFIWAGKSIKKDTKWGTFKDGKQHDERNIQNITRSGYRLKMSRKNMRRAMVTEGFIFLKSQPKGRYVGLYGSKAMVDTLRDSLQWPILPYPKRRQHWEGASGSLVATTGG
jgi:hypothetical protein